VTTSRWRRRRGSRTEPSREAGARADDAGSDEDERRILAALARLRDRTAREVMTPRVDLVALRFPFGLKEVAEAVSESGHSRFPVYEDDLDHLVGVLFVKDVFRSGWVLSPSATQEYPLSRLRKPMLVPESRGVAGLLQEMRQRRIAFAVVVDEYGGVEGVLTVKDLVSELVGDLPDEFDRHEPDEDITRIDSRRWLVGGACPVDRVSAELGVEVPEGEYVTLGGFLFDRFGHIPREGECLAYKGWELSVQQMDRRRVAKVVVTAPSGTIGPAGPPASDGK
jgi:CBS domain containing-hemolysin-like protein